MGPLLQVYINGWNHPMKSILRYTTVPKTSSWNWRNINAPTNQSRFSEHWGTNHMMVISHDPHVAMVHAMLRVPVRQKTGPLGESRAGSHQIGMSWFLYLLASGNWRFNRLWLMGLLWFFICFFFSGWSWDNDGIILGYWWICPLVT